MDSGIILLGKRENDSLIVYIDGGQDSNSPYYLGSTYGSITSSQGLMIGTVMEEDGGDDLRYYGGYIDQVAYWNRALAPSEITMLYNNDNGLAYSQWTGGTPLPLAAGSISIASNTINYNTIPGEITGSAASNGDCGGAYTYQWESQAEGSSWTEIPGANSTGYSPQNQLTVNTNYRRLDSCGTEGVITNVLTISINPEFIPNTITCPITMVDTGQSPGVISSSVFATGGDENISYQWQDSTATSGSWSSITGAVLDSLDVGSLFETTWFRCYCTDGSGNEGYSNEIMITVSPSGSGIVTWDNILGKPAGFADNIDNVEDENAIHTNEPAEINALSTKAVPENSDVLVIEDSSDSYNKKKVLLSTLPGGTGTDDQNATEVLLTSYSMPASGGSIGSSDDVQTAIGKLEKGLESATAGGGEDNVQADWNEGDTGSDAYILNKPAIPGYQSIDVFSLDGTVLSLSLENDSEETKTINLSAIQDGTGTDDQNATEVLLSSYSLPASGGSISSSDDVQTAIGKLEKGLESATAGGGEDNVQANWNEGDTGSDAYILNKPTIPGYQVIDEFSLDGTVLSLSLENDSEATKTINLSAIQDGTGTDNQTIDYFSLDGTTLSLSLENDGESTKTVDLSGLAGSGSVWTDNSTYINYSGKVGINTTRDPGTYHLEVNGSIHAKEVVIDVTNWADYVFGNNYNLKPLNEVESFIKENNHLPEIPTAKEVEEEGIDLGEMNMLLLKKVEELTLYLIEQDRKNLSQEVKLRILEEENEHMKALLSSIMNSNKTNKNY